MVDETKMKENMHYHSNMFAPATHTTLTFNSKCIFSILLIMLATNPLKEHFVLELTILNAYFKKKTTDEYLSCFFQSTHICKYCQISRANFKHTWFL